jgi:hypothetical protein
METIQEAREQGRADALSGRDLPAGFLLARGDFFVAYTEGWFEGAVEATAPNPRPVPLPSTIVAFGYARRT